MRTLSRPTHLHKSKLPISDGRIHSIWLMIALSGLFTSRAHSSAKASAFNPSTQFDQTTEVKYNILAFGDSLTEGFYAHGRHFHPYSIKLQQLFNEHGYSVQVHERGNSGERVVGGMDQRLPVLLLQAAKEGIRFDWVMILGGINDLGWGGQPQNVFRGLQGLYGACRAHGARVLALTCLETLRSRADVPDGRSELNNLIRSTGPGTSELGADSGTEAAGGSGGGGGILVYDLEKVLPFPHDRSDQAAVALWDDGLHLTPPGYDVMAAAVYEALKGRLERGGQ